MADAEDKEKAEKLAAAKKRFEELKKKQKKASKKATTKEREDKTEAGSTKGDDTTTVPAGDAGDASDAEQTDDADTSTGTTKPNTARVPSSLTVQSRQRSASFRKGGTAAEGPKSPTSVDAEGEVQEVYRKQAARIEELEKEVEGLKITESKLAQAEEDLEKLRESSGDVAELRGKATTADELGKEVEKLKSELAASQRQLAQAQLQAASSKNRRASTVGSKPSDLTEQLASKTSTIESLELEISNLRYQISALESDKTTLNSKLKTADEQAIAAETKATSLEIEVKTLKDNIAKPEFNGGSSTGETDSVDLQKRLTVLESDLRTAKTDADAATNKATNLENKIETLTKLHRESGAQNAAREKEVKELKGRVKSLTTARSSAVGEELSDLEEEEREKLAARIRDLEAENFELRRGVWRDKRTAMQPGMEGEAPLSPSYEEVDLNNGGFFAAGPYGATAAAGGTPGRPSSAARQSSTFSDVLQSGISAFTGRDNKTRTARGSAGAEGHAAVARRSSLGLLSEEGFDEDAFRQAQEDEGKARIERIREVKRGLEQWKSWRLNLVELRANGVPGVATGPVFEV